MQKLAVWLVLAVAAAAPAWAQVNVELRLEQEQYLPGEEIVAAVRITNRSGRTIVLGREADWLTFSVESSERGVVPKPSEPAVQGEFQLESGKVATKRVDIGPHFPFNKSGRYSVIAIVRITQWNEEVVSPPVGFDIVEGSKIWQQNVGLPGDDGGPLEVRRYMLQQANYLKGQIRLYVRVTDQSGFKTIRLQTVGRMLSFSRPEPQVDSYSNLHLLYQNGPRSFSYTKYNPDGELLLRRTFEITDTRPRLFVDEEREIGVKGGMRVRAENDVPPSPPEELLPAEPDTNAVPAQVQEPPAQEKTKGKKQKAKS